MMLLASIACWALAAGSVCVIVRMADEERLK